jgi:hypothetical protein
MGDINVNGISHELRTYEVVADFRDIGSERKVEADISGFKVSLDPSKLDLNEKHQAREVLRSALAAPDAQGDL